MKTNIIVPFFLLFLGVFALGSFIVCWLQHYSFFEYDSAYQSIANHHFMKMPQICIYIYTMLYYFFGFSFFIIISFIFYTAYCYYHNDIFFDSVSLGFLIFFCSTSLLLSLYAPICQHVIHVKIYQFLSIFFDYFLIVVWAHALLLIAFVLLTQLSIVLLFQYLFINPLFCRLRQHKVSVTGPCKNLFKKLSFLQTTSDDDYEHELLKNDSFWMQYFAQKNK